MSNNRYIVIDSIKGLAVVGMVIFHIYFLIDYLHVISISIVNVELYIIGKVSAGIFLLISGMNMYFSQQRYDLKRYLKRISTLAVSALGITITTFYFIPEAPVYFGILHFFALSSLLLLPLYTKKLNMIAMLLMLILIQYLTILSAPYLQDWYVLLPFGYYPDSFISIDYYPIFPWIYMCLLGFAIAQLPATTRIITKVDPYFVRNYKLLAILGQYSLYIYLVHIPLLFLILQVFTF